MLGITSASTNDRPTRGLLGQSVHSLGTVSHTGRERVRSRGALSSSSKRSHNANDEPANKCDADEKEDRDVRFTHACLRQGKINIRSPNALLDGLLVDDTENLERVAHDWHCLTRHATDALTFTREELPRGVTPIREGPIALSLARSKRRGDLVVGQNLDPGDTSNKSRLVAVINDDFHFTHPGKGLGLCLAGPEQAGPCALLAPAYESEQLFRQFR